MHDVETVKNVSKKNASNSRSKARILLNGLCYPKAKTEKMLYCLLWFYSTALVFIRSDIEPQKLSIESGTRISVLRVVQAYFKININNRN